MYKEIHKAILHWHGEANNTDAHCHLFASVYGEKNQGLFTSMTFVHKIDIMRLYFGGTCEQELLNSSLSSKIKILTPRYGENGFLRSVCRLCQSEVSSDR